MNGAVVFLLLCVAGGVGASLRFLFDGLIRERTRVVYPVGTTVINVTGSVGLGIITGAAAHAGLPPEVALILGSGLLGGYTTFSTASVETVRLAQERRFVAAAANSLGMAVVCIAGAGLGLALGGVM